MPTKDTMRADRVGVDALDRRQHRIVGDGAHRLAGAREGQEGEQRRHHGDRNGQVLQLLRADADVAEAPVAADRQVVAAQLVAEAEAHHVLERDRQRDRADRRGDEAGGAERLQHELVGRDADHAGDQKGGIATDGTIGSRSCTLAT